MRQNATIDKEIYFKVEVLRKNAISDIQMFFFSHVKFEKMYTYHPLLTYRSSYTKKNIF